MHFFRWISRGFIALLFLSTWAQAGVYSSPMLNEAYSLIDISPIQAKALAEEYLQLRKLADKTEKNPSSISRDETDSRIRTPGSSIDALKILASAEFRLGHAETAFQQLDEAKLLAIQYQLPYLELGVDILTVRLHWRFDGDASVARKQLRDITARYEALKESSRLTKDIDYQTTMLRAEIASQANDIQLANRLFLEVKPYIESLTAQKPMIDYHITVGEHYLRHELYNLALSDLLIAYWKAIEIDASALLAKTNTLLAQLFYERRVFDKALIHLSQAAEFYGNYEKSPILAAVLKRMGDVYFQQGKYNLALVHYFNAIDHENGDINISSVIDVRLNLAATYLQLYNYPLAEQYLVLAEERLQSHPIPKLQGQAALLNAGLAYSQKESQRVIQFAQEALQIAQSLYDLTIEEQAYRLLSLGYEQKGRYANALENIKQSNAITQIRQNKLNQISEDAFRRQKEFAEQALHLVGQEKALLATQQEYNKFQKIAFSLFVTSVILFLFLMRRGYIIQRQQDEIDELNNNLFTHSRSRLPNLRMLNTKLLSSLQRSSHNYEQWHIGELIHEPLNDRLRFVMIDLPFLRNMYLQHGYSAGVEMEHAFGAFLKANITDPSRLYHFSDANLLYIEPNTDRERPPEVLFNKIQTWVDQFQPERRLNRTIRVGIADYPFLPRAYTAINDKELLDILLMATSVARELSLKDKTSHWIYFKAIDNAPAASFASNNIRKCCQQAISQGLIKVHSSCKNEENIKKLLKDG
ncbi:tetratricopeptide repeat protein [Vibrio cincinnatiensis]|uniref:tetratricopeptide repeat protein n=1 Tax=Vibrio cincinnatiensis TaxID=675 RepID=UPI001EDF0EC8|nr:tetratricopeptide repeat protein [Vibrio cincinnatiensis]MCG3758877.1 tetratricopeptide repeat protein [Vibrio cincinnatiensis]MCG3763417.1 tetratricopeptide repeat protein [Vibrio cincinnatiensis]